MPVINYLELINTWYIKAVVKNFINFKHFTTYMLVFVKFCETIN